jgi:hypothetical protein
MLNNRDTWLTYQLQQDKFAPQELILLAVGHHENIYTQPKRQSFVAGLLRCTGDKRRTSQR